MIFFLLDLCDTAEHSPPMNAVLPHYKSLPVPERIRLVGEIWDSIADDPNADLQLSESQMAEVDRRVEAHLANPKSGVLWSEVRRKLFAEQG